MLNPIPSIDCPQARESVSARLDGELSEFEDVRLGAHLDHCAECRAYAGQLAALTAELRAAPLERPTTEVFASRRRTMPASAAAAAVALVAASVVASFALGGVIGSSRSAQAVASAHANLTSLQEDSTQQHLLALAGRLQPVLSWPGRLHAI